MSGFEVECTPMRLELKQRWTIAHGSSDYRDNVLVRIRQDGHVGYGEAGLSPRYAETATTVTEAVAELTTLLQGRDLSQFYTVGETIQTGIEDNNAAKAALDIAVMDLFCKQVGLPYHKLLGVNGSEAPVTSLSIGMDSPDIIYQKVKEAGGFPVLKIKLGSGNDGEIIQAVRAGTDKPLFIDANEGWKTREEALAKVRWLQTCGEIALIEQPMPADMIAETAWVRERSEIPLIADESVKTASDIPRIAQAFDGINVKLMKAGGLQEALRMIVLARTLQLRVMLGCMVESSVGISAAACISPFVDYADLDGNLLLKNDPFGGVKLKDARPVLTDCPGIGIIKPTTGINI